MSAPWSATIWCAARASGPGSRGGRGAGGALGALLRAVPEVLRVAVLRDGVLRDGALRDAGLRDAGLRAFDLLALDFLDRVAVGNAGLPGVSHGASGSCRPDLLPPAGLQPQGTSVRTFPGGSPARRARAWQHLVMIGAGELDEVVLGRLAALDVPGAAVALIQPGREPLVRCYGHADLASGRRVDTTTHFRVGSVTKTMTAIVVLQLVDAGLVGLDDPVRPHLRGVDLTQTDLSGGEITLRHLLTHTSGIGEVASARALLRDPLRAIGAARGGPQPPPLEHLYEDGVVARVAAGRKWAYSNVGFTLLGLAAESITGQPYSELLAERIFTPLGMGDAAALRTAAVDDTLATGYSVRGGVASATRFWDLAIVPAGGVYATIADMVAYANGVLWATAGDNRILQRDTARNMMTPQYGVDARLPSVGLSWWLGGTGSTFTAGHGGTVPGFSTGLVLAPGAGTAVAVLLNRGVMPSAYFGGGHVAGAVLERALGVASTGPATSPAEYDATPRPDAWREQVGVYRPTPGLNTNARVLQFFGGEIEIADAGDHLVARSPIGPFRRGLRLRPSGTGDPDAYSVTYDGYVLPLVFAREAGGDVTALHTGFTPCPFTLERRPVGTRTITSYARIGAAVLGGAVAARAVMRRLR